MFPGSFSPEELPPSLFGRSLTAVIPLQSLVTGPTDGLKLIKPLSQQNREGISKMVYGPAMTSTEHTLMMVSFDDPLTNPRPPGTLQILSIGHKPKGTEGFVPLAILNECLVGQAHIIS